MIKLFVIIIFTGDAGVARRDAIIRGFSRKKQVFLTFFAIIRNISQFRRGGGAFRRKFPQKFASGAKAWK